MNLPWLLLVLLGILALSGCATLSGKKELAADEGLGDDTTALLLNYTIGSDVPLVEACTMSFRNVEQKKDFEVALDLKRNYALLQAPAGHYVAKKLRCAQSRQHDRMEGLMRDRFQLIEGKVSYAGAFDFTFETSSSRLIVRNHDSNETTKLLATAVKELKPATGARIVSAYNGTAITHAVLEPHNVENLGYSCGGPGAVDDRPDQKFKYFKKYEMRRCLEAEVKINPLTIGRLEFRAKYNEAKLVTIDKTIDAHTFSPTFVGCAEKKIRKLVPVSGKELNCDFKF